MRADKYFAEHFGSRTRAKAALLHGEVLKNGTPLSPDDEVSEGEVFSFLERSPFVSQGGDKLERALTVFDESVEERVIADLGASTGGFTDCALRRGAKRIYCVDVGENQLAPALKGNPRIVIMDNTNARYLAADSFPEPVDDVVADLSFISLRLILPAVNKILPPGGRAFVLFKPQFECGGVGLSKRGILPQGKHAPLLRDFYRFCTEISLMPCGVTNAPVHEKKNVEYIVFLRKGGSPISESEFIKNTENIQK